MCHVTASSHILIGRRRFGSPLYSSDRHADIRRQFVEAKQQAEARPQALQASTPSAQRSILRAVPSPKLERLQRRLRPAIKTDDSAALRRGMPSVTQPHAQLPPIERLCSNSQHSDSSIPSPAAKHAAGRLRHGKAKGSGLLRQWGVPSKMGYAEEAISGQRERGGRGLVAEVSPSPLHS